MNHGLLAPQFGLGRTGSMTPDRASHSEAKEPADSATPVQGPVVTFKRRRVLESAEPGADAAPALPAKAPKVYQLQPAAEPVQARELEHPASIVQAEPPAVPKPRRRRDPARKPTLVKHVVFEREPDAVPAPVPAEPARIDGGTAGAKAPRRASRPPPVDLDSGTRRRDVALALDKLLTRLGVGVQ